MKKEQNPIIYGNLIELKEMMVSELGQTQKDEHNVSTFYVEAKEVDFIEVGSRRVVPGG